MEQSKTYSPETDPAPHITVLKNESAAALDIKPEGIYADCTAGYGGDSAEILRHLSPKGRLICIDRDPTAVRYLKKKFEGHDNVTVVHDNFRNISAVIDALGITGLDGILADLGISNVMIKDASRGFSYLVDDAPLDMRMSQEGKSAADILNGESEAEIARILYCYGEEKFSRQIARLIVKKREESPIETTGELIGIIKQAIPAKARREGGNPCKRTFQGLRIAVNGELDDLPGALNAMYASLNPGGRLAIVTFHSLEDKITKYAFNEFRGKCTCPPDSPVCVCGWVPGAEILKPVTPSAEELSNNSMSHSARLRTLVKL